MEAGRFDPELVAGYFSQYEGRFGLFDPARPWMQEPRLPGQMDTVLESGRRKASGCGSRAGSGSWRGAGRRRRVRRGSGRSTTGIRCRFRLPSGPAPGCLALVRAGRAAGPGPYDEDAEEAARVGGAAAGPGVVSPDGTDAVRDDRAGDPGG
ncbi:type I-E CRISPR-associated protein Cse1/CasA [Streptomyces sannanensis]|uniref:type I-E CRISPR-associated protein Cse1/CasA n=1 Tax=Streptomyces sannanensis TaxID=285536 RepID=UPI003CD0C331